jgi:hypothetical protein
MAYKSAVGDLTSQNATETVKTLSMTFTVPQNVKRLIGVGSQVSSAGTTTLEDQTYIIELESDDMSPWGGTQQFLGLGIGTCITAANAYLNPYLHPVDIPVTGGAHIKASVTFNSAQTVNPKTRIQLVYE